MAFAHCTTAAPAPLAGKQEPCPPPTVGEVAGDELALGVVVGRCVGVTVPVPVPPAAGVVVTHGPAPAPFIQASEAEALANSSRAARQIAAIPPIQTTTVVVFEVCMSTTPWYSITIAQVAGCCQQRGGRARLESAQSGCTVGSGGQIGMVAARERQGDHQRWEPASLIGY